MTKLIIVISSVLLTVYGKPTNLIIPTTYIATAPVLPISSQYHAQDEAGQYNYGYVNGQSSKAEVKTLDGVTRGGYSYVDAEGKLQSVEYSSDPVHGFRVAATNLPISPVAPIAPVLPLPLPVKDTPEVAEAKAKHLKALEEAQLRTSLPEIKSEPASVKTVMTEAVKSDEVKDESANKKIESASLVKVLPATLAATPILTTPIHGYGYTAIGTHGLLGQPIISTYSAPWIAPITAISHAIPGEINQKIEAKALPIEEIKEKKE